jgi:hypothetical protein
MYVLTVRELVFVSCWYEQIVRRRLVELNKLVGGMGGGGCDVHPGISCCICISNIVGIVVYGVFVVIDVHSPPPPG